MDEKTIAEKLAVARQKYNHLLRCDTRVQRTSRPSPLLQQIEMRQAELAAEQQPKVTSINKKVAR